MFWSPPTSPLCSSGTLDTVTAPSCEARAPIPSPARSIGQVVISAPAPASSAAANTTIPRNNARKPSRTMRRGEACGNNFGIPTAASKSVIESGSRRIPVSIADNPSATDKYSGTAKNSPACRRYWKKNEVSPPRRARTRSSAGSSSAAFLKRAASSPSQGTRAAPRRPPAPARSPVRGQAIAARSAWVGRSPTCPPGGSRTPRDRGPGPTTACRQDRGAPPPPSAYWPCGAPGQGSRTP